MIVVLPPRGGFGSQVGIDFFFFFTGVHLIAADDGEWLASLHLTGQDDAAPLALQAPIEPPTTKKLSAKLPQLVSGLAKEAL